MCGSRSSVPVSAWRIITDTGHPPEPWPRGSPPGQGQSPVVLRDAISFLCFRNYGEVTGGEMGESLLRC